MLVFDAHLEAVLAVDLGEVVGDLERLADFVGRQEVVAAQVGQVADVEVGQTAVLGNLRDVRDSVCAGIPIWCADRSVARRVQMGKARARLVNGVRG